jgi:hypothetical protein
MKTGKFLYCKLSFILLFAVFSAKVFSQVNTYQPFPLMQGRWVVQKSGPWDTWPIAYSWILYEAHTDTIINSLSYKVVTAANSNSISPGSFGPATFSFAYRNDIPNKKVYIFTDINGTYKDTLWYDFDLNIGDTIKEGYSLTYQNSMYDRRVITSIDSVSECGIPHKRFHFACNSSFQDLGLIEGVGYEDNFLQTGYPDCPFEPIYIYHTDFSCSITSVENRSDISMQIQLFPNPVLNDLQINFSKQNMIFPLEYSIMDCLGKIVSHGIFTDDKSLNVSELNNGLYLLLLQDDEKKIFQSKFIKQ